MAIAKHRMLSGKAWCHEEFWGDILSGRVAVEGCPGSRGQDGLGWQDRAKGMRVEEDPGKCMHVLLSDEENKMELSLWHALPAAWLEELQHLLVSTGRHRAQAPGYLKKNKNKKNVCHVWGNAFESTRAELSQFRF